MTDIATDDGGDSEAQRAGSGSQRRSAFYYSDGQSRPGTARTGMSSRGPWTQAPPLRRGLSGKRVSISGNGTGSALGQRPPSAASRSHVPSLTSHAFFRPMSSQKLQAQRGASRPPTMSRPQVSTQDNPENGGDTARQSIVSTPGSRLAAHVLSESENRPPPSRGTEMTEQETLDRITANTSPTHGHNATASITDSVRPLQRKPGDPRNLTINVDKRYKGTELPSPVRTPRSFRSSFLMPGRTGSAHDGSNREIDGGEKLESVASSPQLPPQNQDDKAMSATEKVKSKLGYNYQYFEGNTVFCIGGRLQNTRHRPINIATASFVVIPTILFFAFSAPWIWFNISPAIPITFAYLFYICMSSFLHASSSDPGILPRNIHRFPPADENEDPLRLGPPTNDWTLVKSSEKSTAAMEVPTKYCKTCNIWRPPRAHHCRLCDNCVETQDHHCVWINNCVGRRNYRFFFTFLASASLLGGYLSGASLAQILIYANQEKLSFGESVSHFRVPFAMVVFGFLGLLYPAALLGYHVFLMARGETTREYLNSHKFLKKDRYRAFTQGSWFKNWFVVLCRPRPPTYYGFKGGYALGDQRLGASTKRETSSAGPRPVQVDSKEGMEMQDVGNRTVVNPQQEQQAAFMGPVALRASSTATANAAIAAKSSVPRV
ncbi:DHHC palmitoyltransferase-domain-containing protein [Lasiosphaeria hispida]|uniref:Palmitoyltransferase n=1 Tax=Lasiosphaeria hispida TaxID=260671 RepID=A0AAJ0MKA7_9PEZI|nr:DHHC palmitoyltransferase-domain-containing protein [Lasiosphaeria hispida]